MTTARSPLTTLRVVSLVPSETESVAALAGLSRLVGRTDYCTEPAGQIDTIPSVGGTKRFDVERVLSLEPDLVLANQEENGPKDVQALIAKGVRVHVSFPRSLLGSRDYLRDLGSLLAVPVSAEIEAADRVLEAARRPAWERRAPRIAALIWREPWMSFTEDTFASDALEAAGGQNVFSGRPRRYPLAADLDPERAAAPSTKDTRYPRFSIAELSAREPEVILLPDEPFAFDETHRRELEDAVPSARVGFVSGKDLFWYGVRAAAAVGRLRALLASLDPGV